MSDTVSTVPGWFRIVSVIGFVWNLMGVMAYLMQVTMSAETLAAMPEADRMLYENIPAWATGAFAIAVFAGTIGSLGLVLRKSWALPVLGASLAAVLVQMIHLFGVSNVIAVKGGGAAIFPAFIVLAGAALLWLANMAKQKGWLSQENHPGKG